MKGKLPSSILRRPKIGLDIPTHEWPRAPLRPLLLDTLSRKAIEETGLFRVEGIEQLIDDHMSRRANLGFHLWGLLILFLWIKQWNIQTQPAQAVMEAEGERAFKIA
jgi:asparagine synthase (glutamine-hydrolysing)